MTQPRALRNPLALQGFTALFLAAWTLIALFPLAWTAIMSFRLPLDGLSSDPVKVLLGPATLLQSGGISPLALLLGALTLAALFKLPGWLGAATARAMGAEARPVLGWIMAGLLYALLAATALGWLLPLGVACSAPFAGAFGEPSIGLTLEHYRSVWIK